MELYTIPHTFNLLATQTKVRRLGYLSFIVQFFKDTEFYPVSFLPQKVEIEAEKINKQLLEYKNLYSGDDKGIINRTKSGISAKYYLNLAEGLKLLTRSNRNYILSKQGRLFLILLNKIDSNDCGHKRKNIFRLNLFEKSFYLLQILENDPIYFFNIVENLKNHQKMGLDKSFREIFYKKILESLSNLLSSELLTKRELSDLENILNRVKSWKEIEKYLEHIIEPRVNWLLDLGFIDGNHYKNGELVLSPSGDNFFNNLKKLYKTYSSDYIINIFIAQNHFFELLNSILDKKFTLITNLQETYELVEKYIIDSFSLFKTLAPSRVNAYQAIYYTSFMLFFVEKRIVEFNTIKKYLNSNSKFSLEWFNSENDGSLKLKGV